MLLMACVFNGSGPDACDIEDVSKVLDIFGEEVAFAEFH